VIGIGAPPQLHYVENFRGEAEEFRLGEPLVCAGGLDDPAMLTSGQRKKKRLTKSNAEVDGSKSLCSCCPSFSTQHDFVLFVERCVARAKAILLNILGYNKAEPIKNVIEDREAFIWFVVLYYVIGILYFTQVR